MTDDFDSDFDPTDTWLVTRDTSQAVLEEIAAGTTSQTYSALEIAGLKAEVTHFDGLIAAYREAIAYERSGAE